MMKKFLFMGAFTTLLIFVFAGCPLFTKVIIEDDAITKNEVVVEDDSIIDYNAMGENIVISGTYYTTAFTGGTTVFFIPDQDAPMPEHFDRGLIFKDQDDTFPAHFGIELNEDCLEYQGSATVEIRSLQEVLGAYRPVWYAQLVKVIDSSDPVCEPYPTDKRV